MLRRPAAGFTFIEAVVSLALIAVLSGMAAPAMLHIIERNKASAGINWLARGIHLARMSAIDHGVMVTLCPTEDDASCGGDWHERVMLFTDSNEDHTVNGSDTVVAYLDFPHDEGTLTWRSFRNRQYLQITPMGFTNSQNGNFVYCAASQEDAYSRQLVINVQGRLRNSRGRNSDGVVVDSNGRVLRC
ncbi:MAG: GspH/FimT family pseudopilin [Pseudomonadales bacterium]